MTLRANFFKSAFSGSVCRASAGALVAAGVLVVSGCNSTLQSLNPREKFTSGYVLEEGALDFVPVGSSREQVLLSLGTPSTTATFDSEEAFYYISQTRVRKAAFLKQQIVDQRVLAGYFGADGRVSQIANYGLQDGKIFDFLTRTTPTGGKDQTFLTQILSGASRGGPPTSLPGF
jgi:outer membrane protein assembly factor BamE (lipoprotein component of BamABCDE complex)